MTRFSIVGLLLFSALCSAQTDGSCSYTFTTLTATFPGTDQTIANGINDRGWIAGDYHNSLGQHGFLLKNGVYRSFDVPFSGAKDTAIFGINLRGQMVGNYTVGSANHGFLLSRGKFKTIDVDFPGATGTFAQGINSDDEIVGA